MILTVTLNPSVDRRYTLNKFEKGNIYRTDNYQYTAGGKGLNVTKVINSLGADVLATGFLGGSIGDYIKKDLVKKGIDNDFVFIEEETRSCLAIISDAGCQTEILESGPLISKVEIENFYKKYNELLDTVDIVCASGSLPVGMDIDTYKNLINLAKRKGKKFLLDTSGDALKFGIEACPYLIKPNKEELEQLTGISILNQDKLIEAVKYLLNKHIEVVVISLGEEGALAFHHDNAYKINIPKVKVESSVGSGDSMIAGLAVGLQRRYDFKDILRLGAACGTANAMESETGKVDINNVNSILEKITIEEFKMP